MPVRVGLKFIDKWGSDLENEVLQYEKEDAEKGQIVFYGPSNFTRWSEKFGHKPLRDVLLGKSGKPCAINRGFGSSCAEHQLYYYPRLIRPLAPKVLVYSCFGNARAFGYTSEEAWELAQRVIAYTLTDFPDVRIYLCSSFYHKNDSEELLEFSRKNNELMKEFVKNNPNVYYLDIFNHKPLQRKDIFVEDGIHYNQEGYDLYAEFFKEALKDELARF